ncbi:MAG: KH domain-containing protein [Candidatus Moraniibacteriota bacterium]
MTTKDAEFVEYMVKAIVDHPDEVKAERRVDEMGVLITLHVHADDMGMVIGRDGSTAKALRTLLRVVGARNNARVNLKISEPEGGKREHKSDRDEEKPSKKEEKREEKEDIEEVVNDLKL